MAQTPDPARELIRAIIESKGIKMADASRRLGKNPAYIQQYLERGSPARLPEEVRESLAVILGVKANELRSGSHPAGTVAPQRDVRPPIIIDHPSDRTPVYGAAEGGVDGEFPFNQGDVVELIPTPPFLHGAVRAYALYVSGDSMSPRYDPGEMIYVHPGRPISIGSDIVIQIRPRPGDHVPRAYIKRLVKRLGSKVVVEQFNPPKNIEFKTDEVLAMHKIVGSGNY